VQILSINGDKKLVLGFLGTTAVGIYGLGRSFTQVLAVSGGIIGPVLYPRITERYGQTRDVASLKNLVALPTLVLGAFLPLLLGYAWFGLPALVRWLLPAFQPGVLSAQILFVATAIYLITGTSVYLLAALRHQVLSLFLYAGGVGLGLAFEYVALRVGWGLAGVAVGAAVGNMVYSFVIIVVALHFCRAGLAEQVGNAVFAMLPTLLVVAICVMVAQLWPVSVSESILVSLGGAFARGTLVALISLPLSGWVFRRAWHGLGNAIVSRDV
jgi:O-antigen/teichoic acid export membrane protein